ncbi:MAG TPA: NUDIX hydrolase [Acidobacteriaceae bacterium]|jgi:ADP-ribose pyrophosphatase|nr:NUDIX hydrolase [Acidobacteriaceae bacterium]
MAPKKLPSRQKPRPSASSKPAPSKAPGTGAAKPPKKLTGRARVLSSKEVYKGKVFSVTAEEVEEPGGVRARRDVVRHNGSVVILAVDTHSDPQDPKIVLIRQYRHAAGQFLLELPAGRIEPGEKLIPAAKRELLEETGYTARRWSRHVRYFASPGFVSEAMDILLAEDLVAGQATPEDDERIEIHLTPLSEAIRLALDGKLHDGKTLIGVLFYAALRSDSTK